MVLTVGMCLLNGCSISNNKEANDASNSELIIRIDAITPVENSLKKAINKYEKEHTGIRIVLNENTEYSGLELKRSLMYSTLTAEDGPDLLYCDRTSMRYFAEKGCLLDLSAILNEDSKKKYLAGIIQSGEYDGISYMLPTHLNLSAVYVNKKVISNEQWSVSDVIRIIQKKEKEGRAFDDIWLMYEGHATPKELLSCFFISDVIHSEFINLETASCDFDSELFHNVLEICKRYGAREDGKYPSSREERAGKLIDENILCISEPLINFSKFSLYGAMLGDAANLIGIPTLSHSGIQLTSVDGICANRYTKEKGAVMDFLDGLFNQQYYETNPADQIPIRIDALDGKIDTDADWTDDVLVWTGNGSQMHVSSKPNGDSFEKEYLELLNRCTSYDENNWYIINIITEESAPFFDGSKEIDMVCEVIQNRVQLYLDENK